MTCGGSERAPSLLFLMTNVVQMSYTTKSTSILPSFVPLWTTFGSPIYMTLGIIKLLFPIGSRICLTPSQLHASRVTMVMHATNPRMQRLFGR